MHYIWDEVELHRCQHDGRNFVRSRSFGRELWKYGIQMTFERDNCIIYLSNCFRIISNNIVYNWNPFGERKYKDHLTIEFDWTKMNELHWLIPIRSIYNIHIKWIHTLTEMDGQKKICNSVEVSSVKMIRIMVVFCIQIIDSKVENVLEAIKNQAIKIKKTIKQR